MKYERYFTENGKCWTESTLIEVSKNSPIIKFNIENQTDLPHWPLNSLADFVEHFERTNKVDLTIPIILRGSDNYILDGWHRLIKALSKKYKELPAQVIINMPKPDFYKKIRSKDDRRNNYNN